MTRETREAIIEKFFDWLSLSDSERKKKDLPLTQTDFAIAHGIPAPTLTIWKKNASIDTVLVKNMLDNAYKLGIEGKYKYAELWAKMTGNYVDKSESSVKVEFTANDYARVAEQVIGGLRASYAEHGGICPVCGRFEILLSESCLDTEPQHRSKN